MDESSVSILKVLRKDTPEIAHVSIHMDEGWSDAEFVVFDGCDSGVKFYFDLNNELSYEAAIKFFENLRSLSTETIDSLITAKYFQESRDALEEDLSL